MTEFVGPISMNPKEQGDPKEQGNQKEARQEGISSKYSPLKPIQKKNKESRKKWKNEVKWKMKNEKCKNEILLGRTFYYALLSFFQCWTSFFYFYSDAWQAILQEVNAT